jgi:hypothetical protein
MKNALLAGIFASTLAAGGLATHASNKTIVWTSAIEHHILPAFCHPHCGPSQFKLEGPFQESYPADLDSKVFDLTCHGNGQNGDPCQFDSNNISIDKTRHIATYTFNNRSDEVWIRLFAHN